ncbi:hypothetical protein L1278_001286 [Pontibacter sp. HSC-36F09]|nr:hypothetical protein [Pontibacter sp. HSC-36F09]
MNHKEGSCESGSLLFLGSQQNHLEVAGTGYT